MPSDTVARVIAADFQVIDGELRELDDGAGQLDFIIRSVRGDETDSEARRPEDLDQIVAEITGGHAPSATDPLGGDLEGFARRGSVHP